MAREKKASNGMGCLGLLIIGTVVYFLINGSPFGSNSANKASLTQKRSDLTQYIGRANGVFAECDDATTIAKRSLQSAGNGGDAVQAYQDAQAAYNACNQALMDNQNLSVPDSLAAYGLGDNSTDIQTYLSDWMQYWDDAKKLLNNPNDVGTEADAKTATDDANARLFRVVGREFVAGAKLKVQHIEKIAPIPPTHS